MPCGDSAPEGHKHSPNDKAFAPVGRIGCYVLVSQGVALGWWLNAPFRGAFGRTIGMLFP